MRDMALQGQPIHKSIVLAMRLSWSKHTNITLGVMSLRQTVLNRFLGFCQHLCCINVPIMPSRGYLPISGPTT
jgi:hypothetical protein